MSLILRLLQIILGADGGGKYSNINKHLRVATFYVRI